MLHFLVENTEEGKATSTGRYMLPVLVGERSSTGQLSDQYWFKNAPNAQTLFTTVNHV